MRKRVFTCGALVVTSFGLIALGGCERKERVLDIKTPRTDVKVDRNVDNGNIEVKTERK
jgi:hypothetical protein